MKHRWRLTLTVGTVLAAVAGVTVGAVAATSTQNVTLAGCLANGRINNVSVTAVPSCSASATPVQWQGQAVLSTSPSPSATSTSPSPSPSSTSASPSPSVTSTTASPTPTPTGTVGGVTLTQIDGGPNYYCTNGFTNACNDGYDNPATFPIFDDYSFYPGNSLATFKDLGLNATVRVTDNPDMSALKAAGITAILGADGAQNIGAESVGGHIEEPDGWTGDWLGVTNQAGVLDSQFGMGGRFYQPSFTWNQFAYSLANGTPCGTTMQDVMTCTSGMPGGRHLNIPTADVYWFSCSTQAFCHQHVGPVLLGTSGDSTPDQLARGNHYGDMVDAMRAWVTKYPAPTAPYIENSDALSAGQGARDITPPEMNWAVWSSIVHGARFIMWFGTTSDEGCTPTYGFCTNVQSGQSVSNYDQAKATDTLVTNLARIINSQFAVGYATVTPAAYTFPVPDNQPLASGIDVMSKYYTGGDFSNSSGSFGNGFYIFASQRGSESQSNVNATFTTTDGYTGPVTVVGENRTVQATSGQFTDTFATGATVHIYKIG